MDQIVRISGMENCYLVKGDHTYLVDTMAPFSQKKLYAALQKNGVKPDEISHILITHYHFDHAGSIASLKSKGQPMVVAGSEDVPYIEGEREADLPSDLNRLGKFMRKFPKLVQRYQRFRPSKVDLAVRNGESLEELGLEVISLPGHTPGGTGYLDRANRRAFIGDLVANYFGRLGLPVISASYSLQDIEASMRKLVELELDYMYPGHGSIIGPNASKLVAGLVKKKF